jgi:hypothetical protein
MTPTQLNSTPAPSELTGEIVHMGLMMVSGEALSGVFVQIPLEDLHALKHPPLYKRVTLVPEADRHTSAPALLEAQPVISDYVANMPHVRRALAAQRRAGADVITLPRADVVALVKLAQEQTRYIEATDTSATGSIYGIEYADRTTAKVAALCAQSKDGGR